jgi:dsRNA-specific ribonuclease
MDKFLKSLEKKTENIQQALTDTSYKKLYQKTNHNSFLGKVNFDLATYGDAILKMVLCKILFEEGVDKITVKKEAYEKDKVLVQKIASYYDILSYMRFDKDDSNLPQDYNYNDSISNAKNPHKYIATAVEACLAAIYEDEKSIDVIEEIVRRWMEIIDNSKEKELRKE